MMTSVVLSGFCLSVIMTVTLLKLPQASAALNKNIPPPAAAIFLIGNSSNDNDYYNSNKEVKQGSVMQSKRTLVNDIVNTEVEVEPGKNVELECLANHPVQWNYRGIGKPEFTTNVSTDLLNNREVHKASLIISNANEKNTGLYICSYTEFPDIHSTYYLFIPGSQIFVSATGRVINYSIGQHTVTIPCPVSVKTAKVTLRRNYYYDNTLRNVDPGVAVFDPKSGFKLNVRDLRDADGIFICSASLDGHLEIREFTLRNQERNQTSVTFPDGIQEDINPCQSFACPSRSVCRVNLNTNLPFCACRPKTGSTVTNCTRLCKTTQECPKSEKCQFSVEKQLKMCTHVCEGHSCAENAECHVDEQRGGPKCRCRRGYQGNGNFYCDRIPIKSESDNTSYCTSSKCGPHASCQHIDGKARCACKIGSVGKWPDCAPSCTKDEDCDLQDICNEKGICEHVCTENMCAPKAECKVLQRKPQCLCPPGYTGKATEACYPSHFYYSSRSDLDSGVEIMSDYEGTTTIPLTIASMSEEESLQISMPTNEPTR